MNQDAYTPYTYTIPSIETRNGGVYVNWCSHATNVTPVTSQTYTFRYPPNSVGSQSEYWHDQILDLMKNGVSFGQTLNEPWPDFTELLNDSYRDYLEKEQKKEAERRKWLADFDELIGGEGVSLSTSSPSPEKQETEKTPSPVS